MSTIQYKCIEVFQRGPEIPPKCLLFPARAGDIEKWAAIERLTAEEQKGPQRIKKPYKVKAIRDFFHVGANNIIPTAVVIGLSPGKSTLEAVAGCEGLHTLTVNFDESTSEKAGTIVDGQHRILGMSSFNPEILVNVVAIADVDDAEVAFQFIVINNKAAKVSSDHLRALALKYSEEDLSKRLQSVKLRLDPNLRFVGFADNLDESPFKGVINLPTNPEESRFVPPTAIEESIAYIKLQRLQEFSDDDMVLGMFFTIWAVIRSSWQELWNSESKLLNKVSVICLTQFFVDNLLRQFDWGGLDIFDLSKVEAETKRILAVLEPQFWHSGTEWTAKGLDTPAGRAILLGALDQMVRNARQKVPWYTEITMVRVPEIPAN